MENLKRLYVASIIYEHNMRMLHWFCKGKHFDTIHAITNEYYNKFNSNIDSLGEMLMMLGSEPLSLHDALAYAEADTAESYCGVKEFSGDDNVAYMGIDTMLTHIIKLYDDATKDDTLPGDIISELQTQQYYFRLEGMYKNKRRMM